MAVVEPGDIAVTPGQGPERAVVAEVVVAYRGVVVRIERRYSNHSRRVAWRRHAEQDLARLRKC